MIHSHAHLPGHPPARPTYPDALCEVVIESKARPLIRHLGQWCVLADHNHQEISPPPCAGGLVLTASWNQGTLDIQAHTAQGGALSVHILA